MSDQYQQYSTVKKYWQLMRPHTLTAAVVPVLVGTAAAKIYLLGSEDHLKFSLFLAMLVACLLIQAATNMFNEYYDFKKGLDDHTSVGIGGAIVRNGMSPKQVMNLAIAFYIIAALLGIFLAIQSSFWIIPVGIVCMAIGYLYTGGPIPISWTPFGELFSGLFMGMIIILLSFFIQTGNVQGYAVMYAVAYIIVIITAFFKPAGSLFYLLVLLSFPMPIKAVRRFNKNDTPETMMPAMAATGKTNTFFGLLYALGIYISALLG
ncbi:MAG: 1,4-dihydroxy-2-naphthoate polyprenyltransferase, partial [Staphylococcus epidermidis]|nr:1,4-dihydroxy-2-naphthoate polyprenyltransferase [Staphylococcus epidermidis]